MAKSLISLGLDDAIDPALQEKVHKALYELGKTPQWPLMQVRQRRRGAGGA